jgi:anti-sigma regulatory factor (Ser/Thr protein kinase)
MNKVFLAKIDLLRSMLDWISTCLVGWDRKSLRKVELASEEALVNIIHHAYQERPEKIEISVKVFPKSHAEIVFKDHGPPFDPLQMKAPDCSGRLEDREVGGLGIHLMRQYMDEVRYHRESNCNVLVFVIRSSQNG